MRSTIFIPEYERANLDRRLREMGFKSYDSYLNSGSWGNTRRRLMRTACEICSAGGGLVLHHMTYAHLGAERAEDVCTLCQSCHGVVHTAALRGGTLYPERVVATRAGRPPREKQINAQKVRCPECNAKTGYPCFLPSGNVRTLEHKERRQLADQVSKQRFGSQRRKRSKKSARSRRLSEAHAQVVDLARNAEFPLDALRAELDDQMSRSLRRDTSV